MDIAIKYIPYGETEWTVTKELAKHLHSDDFKAGSSLNERKMNFQVR
jgi:hypothetical protein